MLEITETALMRDPAAAADVLRELKALGVHVAIDDFGTGYSSLAYLQQLPVDSLKIDRTFIAASARSRESDPLIQTLVQLGRALGLRTVAEGIEDEAQLAHLRELGCDTGQGYLFAPPLEVAALERILADAGRRDRVVSRQRRAARAPRPDPRRPAARPAQRTPGAGTAGSRAGPTRAVRCRDDASVPATLSTNPGS